MKRFLLALVFSSFVSVAMAAPDIFVAYPDNKSKVAFDHVLLEGSVTAGADFMINGKPIDVGTDGLFIEWYPLVDGLNKLEMKTTKDGESGSLNYEITSNIPKPIPETPTKIDADSVEPYANHVWYTLENGLLEVKFRGSPKGTASFMIGDNGPFKMLERNLADFPGVNPLAAAFELAGNYKGSYILQASDNFDATPVKVSLKGTDGNTVDLVTDGKLTYKSTSQPRVGMYTAKPLNGISGSTEVARNGFGRAYILYPREGSKFVVVGEEASTYRCKIAPGQIVYVRKDRMRLLSEGAPIPNQFFTTIRTKRLENRTQVRFALSDRVPFAIDHNAQTQSLELRLFYTNSDIDYIVSSNPDPLIRDIRWQQRADAVTTVNLDFLGKQLWGYTTFYEGNTLVLEFRDAPKISVARPLEGQKITVDAGHGGEDTGGAGSLRVPEKDIVLAISKQLKAALERRGAIVTMTRETDVEIPLLERSVIADKAGSSVFVSIHGNALPDGVDPRTLKGFGSFYFQPQSRALAQTIQDTIRSQLPDYGDDGTHYQNLAVTRPTQMLQVLLETGFLTDKSNLRFMMSPNGQSRLAEGIAIGLERFYRNNR